MTRRSITDSGLQGLIIINKPPGITSFRVVARVRNLLRVRKAGHTGTLDPFASGVLPVCLNEATKIVSLIMEGEKEYEGVIHLGIETDTQDVSGHVTAERALETLTELAIQETFRKFQGVIAQVPPMYSALKHKGQPLYYWARQGRNIERGKRVVEVRKLSLERIELPRIFFRVVCSPGTYIRTLASDIGKELGCGAFLEDLTRTRSGFLSLSDSISLDDLERTPREEIEAEWLIPLSKALSSFPSVTVNDELARKVSHGNAVVLQDLIDKTLPRMGKKPKVQILNQRGDLLAMAEACDLGNGTAPRSLDRSTWKLLRVFAVGK